MVLLAGCQNPKNELLPQEVKTEVKSQFRANNTNMSEILQGSSIHSSSNLGEASNELNDENLIDQYLFHTAQELKNIIATKLEIRDWIISQAQSTNSEVVKIKDLVSAFPELASKFSSLGKKFKLRNYQYEIDFLAINANNATLGGRSIIAPGFELHDDISSGESDIIFGWLLDKNTLSEINLSENDVNSTDTPVIISTLTMTNQIANDGVQESANNERVLRSQGYRISFRYERSNHSEFTCQAYRYDLTTSSWKWIQNASSFWEIASIHKSNVNTALSSLKAFCPECNASNAASNRLIFNTYERDWYASKKELGNAVVAPGVTGYVGGRMKFSDEWYGFSPNAPLPIINLVGIFNGTQSFRYSNWKGHLDLLAN